jgi:hypothetical protein
VTKLITSVHAQDTTRPTIQAYAAWVTSGVPTGLEDLVGINYAPDRYDSVHTANSAYKMLASESSSAFRSRGITTTIATKNRLTTLHGRAGAPARSRRGTASTPAPGLPASSFGPASITSASLRRTSGLRRARTSA